MAGRPRLVHEGSPIIDDLNSGLPSPVGTATSSSDDARADNSHHASSLGGFSSAAGCADTTSKPYKLQTRLVVGDASNEGDDSDMMMDEDDHTQQNQHRSNWGDHRDNGHEHHVYHRQQQQYNMGHPMLRSPHRQQQMSSSNEFYNNGHSHVPPINPIHHAHVPPPNPPPPLDIHNPLVVLDAANIAYNYAESSNPCQGSQRRQPDPRGIRLAIEYFLKHQCRVQAVVPISWYQLKPRPADQYHLKNRNRGDSDAKMVTEEVEELRTLRQQGFLVACPPGDDDDAYALALARREEDRLVERQGMDQDESMGMEEDKSQSLPKTVLGGYVVSNDFFQDAVRRDEKKHCQHPLNMRPISLRNWLKKNRISYSFANVGTAGRYGEIRLEFIPNPRNHLIEALDGCSRLNGHMR